jgi:DnaJ like chaperone protein
MAKFGKWIGAGIGAFAGGPIGAIVGFVIGSAFDKGGQESSGRNVYEDPYRSRRPQTTSGGYAVSLLVLVAAVMKADGKTMKSELQYVKEFFVRNFGLDSANEAIAMLQDLLQQNIPVGDVCHQIQRNMDHASRLQLLHFLFGIAQADGSVHPEELKLIDYIAHNMGISSKDFESIKSMFIKNTEAAYKILEIDPAASDDEVKKAYRRMALKYHPDKVSYLGDEFQLAAKEKFQKLNEAYEEIKKIRNIA